MASPDAMIYPGLVTAMYQQLDNDFLDSGTNQQLYTVIVEYQGYNFRITGTYSQWFWFFKSKLIVPKPSEI